MKFKAIFFDLDGTLLNTLGDLAAAVNFSLDKNGLPCRTEDEVKAFIGNGIPRLIERAIGSGNAEKFEAVLADFKVYYVEHSADRTSVYADMVPLLEKLRGHGCRLAVVSNKSAYALEPLVEKYFGGLFNAVIGASESVPVKPSPVGVNGALKTLGLKAEDCVFVGDSDVDFYTAQNAKMPCILVNWGYRPVEMLKSCAPYALVDTARELYTALTEE